MSFIAPILPENAPFSPLQRAWLDGFLAGLIGDDGTPFSPSSPGLTRGSLDAATDAHGSSPWAEGPRVEPGHDGVGEAAGSALPAAAQDFPWHDPGLPLDERIALA